MSRIIPAYFEDNCDGPDLAIQFILSSNMTEVVNSSKRTIESAPDVVEWNRSVMWSTADQ